MSDLQPTETSDTEVSSDPWAHVTVLSKNGSNTKWKCNICGDVNTSSRSRVVAHLGGRQGGSYGISVCPEVQSKRPQVHKAMKRLLASSESTKAAKTARAHAIQTASQVTASSSGAGSSGTLRQPCIQEALAPAEKHAVDIALAEFMFAAGRPLSDVENKYFVKFLAAVSDYAANGYKHGRTYRPPTRKTLSTTLLDEVHAKTKERLQTTFMQDMHTNCVTVVSDGWSDVRNTPLINVLTVNHKGTMFNTAINTAGDEKTADYIAEAVGEFVQDQPVVQVVMDGAAACVAAGQMLEEKYPSLTFSIDVPHRCDLFLEDVGKLGWAETTVKQYKKLVQAITNHHMPLAVYREVSAEGAKKELLKPAETRFATNFIGVSRLLDVRNDLESLVVHAKFREWGQNARNVDAYNTVRTTVNSEQFWEKCQKLVDLTEPIVKLLRVADKGEPCLGYVYKQCKEVDQHLRQPQGINAAMAAQVRSCWNNRKEYIVNDLHRAAYVLTPAYAELQPSDDAEAMTGFYNIASKLVPEGAANVARELSTYWNKEGLFAVPQATASIGTLSPRDWWQGYGAGTKTLKQLAMILHSQPASSSACERNWSTYDFIHNKKRNKLTTQRAQDLVWVFTNLRLADKLATPQLEHLPLEDFESSEEDEIDSADELADDDLDLDV